MDGGAPGAGSSSASVSFSPAMAEELFTVESAEANKDTAEILKAEKTALALIARAEQCSWGLKCKLEKKKYCGAAVQTVLDRLMELNLVNDRRFAELWLKSRITKGKKGPRILLQRLGNRGIDREIAAETLTALLTQETEAALLRRCLEKADKENPLIKNNAKNSAGSKTEIRFFLKRQGFSAAAIEEYFEEPASLH